MNTVAAVGGESAADASRVTGTASVDAESESVMTAVSASGEARVTDSIDADAESAVHDSDADDSFHDALDEVPSSRSTDSASESEDPVERFLDEDGAKDAGSDDEDKEEKEEKEEEEEARIVEEESKLTEDEKQERLSSAQQQKTAGNDLFKASSLDEAVERYTEALLTCPRCYAKQRAVMFSNRAACRVRQERSEDAIADCDRALGLDPAYVRALVRRAELYERTTKLDEALADFQRVVELDPSLAQAQSACRRLPDEINARNEKMKEEMMGKLKELGNMVLKPFGLSTSNFKVQQDPATGSYSMSFQQNGK